MAEKLITSVFLREPKTDTRHSFGPGDDLPEWALEQVKGQRHLFEEGVSGKIVRLPAPYEQAAEREHPVTGQPQSKEPAATEEGKSDLVDVDGDEESEDEESEDEESDEAPSRAASEADWREFAESEGVPVTDSMKRNDIIAACEEAGVIEPKK